jgi:two-component system phosphate regulon response regulator OmpR
MSEALKAPFDNMHVLIVDDDVHIRQLLSKYLKRYNYRVTSSSDAQQARGLLKVLSFDIIILDVMMPGETGIELSKFIGETLKTPVILLTALGDTENRIKGLKAGVDDYLAKPFEPQELLLRISAILKRSIQVQNPQTEKIVRIGNLLCNLEAAEVIRDDKVISLTALEASLMSVLIDNLNQPVSRIDLLKCIKRSQGGDDASQERIVDVQITRLRRKIEPHPNEKLYLRTVRGEGYMLTDQAI